MRCIDPWYQQSFLFEARNGELCKDNYFYLHGAPTAAVGSMVPGEDLPRCCNARCVQLQRHEWAALFMEGATGEELMRLECDVCKVERAARCRVVLQLPDARFREAPFDAAPFVCLHNVPKHAAFLRRAQVFAEERSLVLNWVKAHDSPLHRDDQALGREQLDAKRFRWLSFHDQHTAGILGLMPLVKGLPVRLSDSVDRRLNLFKHRRGKIEGWTLHPDETSVVAGGQRILEHAPLCIFVRFEGDEWQIGDLDTGVYPLRPTSRSWFVNVATRVKAKRYGFTLLPDLAGTDHMYQGATLQGAIVDLLECSHKPTGADAMAGYVGSSRVKLKEDILIDKPFSPALFLSRAGDGTDRAHEGASRGASSRASRGRIRQVGSRENRCGG